MINFAYYNPVKIIVGQNSLEQLNQCVAGRKALLLTSSIFSKLKLTQALEQMVPSIAHIIDEIDTLPTFELLEKIYGEIEKVDFDLIIALGGGSVIDSAKVLSVHSHSKGFSFVEKLIKNEIGKQGYHKIPVIAVPTTAGTSSELTPWATVWQTGAHAKKYSLHLPDLWCEAAVYDPELTLSMPKSLTIQTALDALSHSLESIWNKNSNPISRRHAIFAAKEICRLLPQLVKDEQNIELRSKIMLASMHAGLAFSNTQTAIAHAMSYYMTIHKNVPHGIACSFTLPAIVDAIIGNNTIIDNTLKEIFGVLSSEPLRLFFGKIGVSANWWDYGLTIDDLEKIRLTVGSNVRAQNSLVAKERLFNILEKKYNAKQHGSTKTH